MEEYKNTLYKAFQKYDRMKKIAANPISQKVTLTFQNVMVKGGMKENQVENLIIRKTDAEGYMYLIDEAIRQLENSQERPYQQIIKMKYKDHCTAQRISMFIDYSVQHYFVKLKEAQISLCEILDLWGVDIY